MPRTVNVPVFERVWWNPLTWFIAHHVVVQQESEWATDQVDALLGYVAYQADLGSHGQPMSESMSPLADAANWGGEYYYEVDEPLIDHAGKALAVKRKLYEKQNPEADMSYLRFPVRKVFRPVPERPIRPHGVDDQPRQ